MLMTMMIMKKNILYTYIHIYIYVYTYMMYLYIIIEMCVYMCHVSTITEAFPKSLSSGRPDANVQQLGSFFHCAKIAKACFPSKRD